jgi:hypothetical protein
LATLTNSFNSTSTYGNGLLGVPFPFTSLSSQKPSPYTGSYLPAIIYVFDFEIDLEKASYEQIARQASQIIQEVQTKQTEAWSILSRLEKAHPSKMAYLKTLHERKANAEVALRARASGIEEPSKEERIEAYKEENRKHHEEMAKEQLDLKKSKSKAKRLFKKLSSICHPDKTNNDETLADIFIAGKLALELDDIQVLISLITQANNYLSGDVKRNRLDRFKIKKKKAKEQLAQANQQNYEFQKSFHAAVLAHKDDKEGLEALFLGTIDNSIQQLEQQIRFYEHTQGPQSSSSLQRGSFRF